MDLPYDEWTHVISFLDYRDLGALARTGRAWAKLVDSFLDPTVDDQMPIIVSASRGYVLAVAKLLADPRVDPYVDDCLPIRAAVQNGQAEAVQLLMGLSYSADLMNNLLYHAVINDDLATVRVLVQDQRVDPTHQGYRCLHQATMGSDQLFQLLVKYGYNHHALDGTMSVAKARLLPSPPPILPDAASVNNLDLVQYLAPTSCPGQIGRAIWLATLNGHDQIVDLLSTYDHPRSSQSLEAAVGQNHDSIARLLIDRGYVPTPACLRLAVCNGNVSLVKLFLTYFDPDDLLIEACKRGHESVVKCLIPVTDLDKYGSTALLVACRTSRPSIVKLLIEHQNIIYGCLERAAEAGSSRLVDLLIDRLTYTPDEALNQAASRGHVKIVKRLLAYAQPTSLTLDLAYTHWKVVRLLLPVVDPSNDLLKLACAGHPKTVRLLIRDPRVDPRDPELLIHAQYYPEVIKLLLKDGRLDPGAKDNLAIRTIFYPDTVKLLLRDPRVDPTARQNEALRTASLGCPRVVRMLLNDPRIDPIDVDQLIINSVLSDHLDIFMTLVKRFKVKPERLLNLAPIDLCLRYAIRQNDLALIQWFQSRQGRISPELVDYGCRYGNYDLVTYLLTQSNPGPNAIYYARANHQVLKLLIQDGRAKGHEELAIESGLIHSDFDLIRTLVERGYGYGHVYQLYRAAIKNKDESLLKLLVRRLDPSDYGKRLVHMGDEQTTRILLRHPALESLRRELAGQ